MWNLKHETNERIYETETDSQTDSMCVVAMEERRGGGWIGISRRKLLYIRRIIKKKKKEG